MSLYTFGKGLFEAGKLGLKKYAKKGKKYYEKKAATAKEKLSQAGETIDRTFQGAKQTGAEGLRQTKILGKNLLRKPRTPKFEKRTVLGKGRDLATIGLTGADIAQTGYQFAPLFQEDEDFTAANAAFGLAGLAGLVPLGRATRRSFRRLGLDKDATRAGGKESLDVTKLDRKIERPFERAALAGTGLGGTALLYDAFGPKPKLEVPKTPELTLGLEDDANQFDNLIEKVTGPKEKEVLRDIEQKRQIGKPYSDEEVNTMLETARATDRATEAQKNQEEPITPGEAARPPGDGGEPPVTDIQAIDGAVEDPDSALTTEKPPGTTEIDIDKNPEAAVNDADKTATDLLKNPGNPTGDKNNPAILPPASIDIGGITVRAEFMKKDFEGVKAAMKRYEEHLQGKRDKMMTFEQYQEKYKDILGGGDFAEEKNLAMFKWAMAMMTGRTNEAGLMGFLDIAGQAGLVYADDVAAIQAQQRAERQAIGASFLQYEQDLQKYLDAGELTALQNDVALQTDIANEEVNSRQQYFNNLIAIADLQDRINARKDAANKQMSYDKNREFIMVNDDKGFEGKSRKEIAIGKDGKRYEIIQTGIPGVGEKMVPLTEGGPSIQPLSPERTSKVMSQLSALNLGIEFADRVIAADTKFLGTGGAIEGFFTNFTDLMNEWGSMTGILNNGSPAYAGDLSSIKNNTMVDAKIQEMIINNAGYKGMDKDAVINKDKVTRERNRLLAQYNKDQAEAVADYTEIIEAMDKGQVSKLIKGDARKEILATKDKSLRERKIKQLAELRLIQNRMKYIVANADKGEDRLTVADVNNAAQTTAIFEFLKAGKTVRANYTALKQTLNARATQLATQFNAQAGDMSLVKNLTHLDYVRRWMKRTGQDVPNTQSTFENTDTDSLFGVLNIDLGGTRAFPRPGQN